MLYQPCTENFCLTRQHDLVADPNAVSGSLETFVIEMPRTKPLQTFESGEAVEATDARDAFPGSALHSTGALAGLVLQQLSMFSCNYSRQLSVFVHPFLPALDMPATIAVGAVVIALNKTLQMFKVRFISPDSKPQRTKIG